MDDQSCQQDLWGRGSGWIDNWQWQQLHRPGDGYLQPCGWGECQSADLSYHGDSECSSRSVGQLHHHERWGGVHDRQTLGYVDNQRCEQDLRGRGSGWIDNWQWQQLCSGRWGYGDVRSCGWRECQSADLSHHRHVECDGGRCVGQLHYYQRRCGVYDRQTLGYVDNQRCEQDVRGRGSGWIDYWQWQQLCSGRWGYGDVRSCGWRECQSADLSHHRHVECDGGRCVGQLHYYQRRCGVYDRQTLGYVDNQRCEQDVRGRGSGWIDYW